VGGERPPDELGAFVVGPRPIASGAAGGPLAGRRFAVKDLFDVAGLATGAGNPDFLADAPIATRHAPAVSALLAAGADLVGKTVTDELAYSLSGTNVHYGTPRNPAAPGRVPGGSSSGSASAVAGRVVDFALGTDTGGSIRVPASYCGICGLRPSHGAVSCEGVVPLAPSFDTVGLLAADGRMLEAAFEALLAGAPGPLERRGRQHRPDRLDELRRLVVLDELDALVEEESREPLAAAVEDLAALLGAEVVAVRLGDDLVERARQAFRTLQMREAWRSHGAWIGERHPRLGPGVAARFAAAARVSAEQAAEASLVREEVRARLVALLGEDALLAQAAACGPAPLLDEAREAKEAGRWRTLGLTAPAGLAGAPVVALPLVRAGGLPLGLALVGLPGDDELLADLAARAVPPG